jgi:hypothetical protein
MADVKERPILFQGAMVRALLAGTKTQTRRVVKPQPHPDAQVGGHYGGGPYGQPGDRLWVREAFRMTTPFDKDSPARVAELCLDAGYPKPWAPIQYEADGRRDNWTSVSTIQAKPEPGKLRPGIHMPRWASRILLEVTAVRVERLQEITHGDIEAEGIPCEGAPMPGELQKAKHCVQWIGLWEAINGKGSWVANPWVWVVEFKKV